MKWGILMRTMIALFGNRNFLKLFLASFTSQMGGTIGITALMFYLLNRYSEKPAYATVTELMLSLPTLAVFFLVGVFADRLDRQRVAKNCDWICAVLSILMLLALVIDVMPIVFTLLFLRGAVKSFFYPAQSSIVQGILDEKEYPAAAGLNQMVASLFVLFGSGIGIISYWSIGIEGAILIDALSFIASGLLIHLCRISEDIRLPNGKHSFKDLKIRLVLDDFKEGLLYIKRHKLLLTLVSGFVVFGILNGGLSVMQVFILKYKLSPTNYEEISIILGFVFGSGVLAGSLLASSLSHKLKLQTILISALLAAGGATILSSIVNNVWLYMLCTAGVALAIPMINVAIGGWMPKIVDPKMMGRVQGCVNPLMMFSQTLTLLFIAALYPVILTVESLYWLVGGCLIVVGFFYMIALPKFNISTVNKTASSVLER